MCLMYVRLHDTLQVQDMLEKRKTRTREALALMWCAGQLPEKNLTRGLRGLLLLNTDNYNQIYDDQSSVLILSE